MGESTGLLQCYHFMIDCRVAVSVVRLSKNVLLFCGLRAVLSFVGLGLSCLLYWLRAVLSFVWA